MRVDEIDREMIKSFIQARPKKFRSKREVTVTPEGTHFYYKGQKIAAMAGGILTIHLGVKGTWANHIAAKLMHIYGIETKHCYPNNKGWGPTFEPYPLAIDIQTKKILNPIPVDKYVKHLLLAREPYSLELWVEQCEAFGLLTDELKNKIAAKRVAYRLMEAV